MNPPPSSFEVRGHACTNWMSHAYKTYTCILSFVAITVSTAHTLLFPSQYANSHVVADRIIGALAVLTWIPIVVIKTVGAWVFRWVSILAMILLFLRFGSGHYSGRVILLRMRGQFPKNTGVFRLVLLTIVIMGYMFVRGITRSSMIGSYEPPPAIDCVSILAERPTLCGARVGDTSSLCVRNPDISGDPILLRDWYIRETAGRATTVVEQASACPEVKTPRARFSQVVIANGTNTFVYSDGIAFCIQHWFDVISGTWVC